MTQQTDQKITPLREADLIQQTPKQLYIDGEWTEAEGGRTLDVVDPSTGQVLCAVADAGEADGWRALKAAERAQAGFAAMSPRERSDILMRAFGLMHERKDDLALLMTLEMGKPLPEPMARSTMRRSSSGTSPRRSPGSAAATRSPPPAGSAS